MSEETAGDLELFEELEAAEPWFTVDGLREVEAVWQESERTRRAATAVLTKSGSELISTVLEDRAVAVSLAGVSAALDGYLSRLDGLKEMLEHAQSRILLALCSRDDMRSVIEEGERGLQ